MTTIAQSADVTNLLGAANPYATAQIAAGLSWASSFIREYCQQQFDYVAADVVMIDPRPDHTAQLPEGPVLNVESVQAYMADPVTGVWDWQPLTMFAFVARGLLWDTTNVVPPIIPTANIPLQSWPTTPGSLKVTYDHGYMAAGVTAFPQPLIDCCARLACQYLENPTLLTERRVGSVMGRFGTTRGGVEMSPLDAAILDRFAVVDFG